MFIKKKDDIAKILKTGKLMGEVLDEVGKIVKPGISAWEVDQKAEALIREVGGEPAFKGYKAHPNDTPFPSTICASVNEEVVHGIATKEKILKDGDIFSIDVGMWYPSGGIKTRHRSVHTKERAVVVDTAITLAVGTVNTKTKQLLDRTREALELGIQQCMQGNSIASIGKAIESYIEPFGYGVIRDLVGHGTGYQLHEEPAVPNYYDKNLEQWILEPNAVIAIEPMITLGDYHIDVAEDGWSISTLDHSLSAHFEHTIVITKDGPIVATRRMSERV